MRNRVQQPCGLIVRVIAASDTIVTEIIDVDLQV